MKRNINLSHRRCSFWNRLQSELRFLMSIQTVFWKKNRSHGYRSQIFPAKGPFTPVGRALEEQKSMSQNFLFLDPMRPIFFGVWNLSFWQYFATFDRFQMMFQHVVGFQKLGKRGACLGDSLGGFQKGSLLPLGIILCYQYTGSMLSATDHSVRLS